MTDVHPGPAAIRPLDIVPIARETGDRPFPQLLRSRRVLAGLTQQALADLSTISPRTIRDLEAGRANARAQTLQLLADALQLTGLVREIFVQAGRGGRSADPFGAGIVPAAPRPVSALLGREQEVRALASVLESGRSRMLSISGFPVWARRGSPPRSPRSSARAAAGRFCGSARTPGSATDSAPC